MPSDAVLVLVALWLVLLNAFFVAAEFAMVRVRTTRIAEIARAGDWRAKAVEAAQRRLDAFLSATQLGVTLTSLGLGWIGEPAFAHLLAPVFKTLGITSERVIENTSITIAFAVITQSAHTRFPLASSDIDHVVGMVHVKDLFQRRTELRSSEDLAALKRPILFVPESRPLDALQRDFQDGRTHMAIVVDEYGGTSGLVTLEDVIEELIGDIQDEFDREPPQVEQTAQGFVFDGLTPIDAAAERLQLDLPHPVDVSTLAGLVTARIGRIPRRGDTVALPGYELRGMEMNRRRVGQVLAVVVRETEAGAAGRCGHRAIDSGG